MRRVELHANASATLGTCAGVVKIKLFRLHVKSIRSHPSATSNSCDTAARTHCHTDGDSDTAAVVQRPNRRWRRVAMKSCPYLTEGPMERKTYGSAFRSEPSSRGVAKVEGETLARASRLALQGGGSAGLPLSLAPS